MKKFWRKLKRRLKIAVWLALAIVGMLLACYGFAQVIVLERLEVTDIVKIVATFVAGFVCFILGVAFMQKRLLDSAVSDDVAEEKALDLKDKGPNIVVIGGGIGLTRVLKGLKNYTNNLTAIVTVSSYGNENKRRPTDDMRSSLVALAKNEEEMQTLLDCQMGNTKFGDIYLSVVEKANKNLNVGVEKSNTLLAITGKVLPVTLDEMKICVELEDGTVIEDREKIAEITSNKATQINRVYINPTNCRVAPGVIEAIQSADAIVMGPGELYTGVIPNLLIRNVAKTIRETKAFKIYISNIMTQPGHTDDYAVSDHINAITEHAGKGIINYCVCDNGDIIPEILRKYINMGANLVELDKQNIKGVKIIRSDVSTVEGEYIRHDSDLTARVIIDLIVNELKFKDKQKDEQFALLNQKLKETKKKVKERKKQHVKVKKPRYKLKSKFSNKYKERILSIKESEENTERNRRREEKIKRENKERKAAKKAEKAQAKKPVNKIEKRIPLKEEPNGISKEMEIYNQLQNKVETSKKTSTRQAPTRQVSTKQTPTKQATSKTGNKTSKHSASTTGSKQQASVSNKKTSKHSNGQKIATKKTTATKKSSTGTKKTTKK